MVGGSEDYWGDMNETTTFLQRASLPGKEDTLALPAGGGQKTKHIIARRGSGPSAFKEYVENASAGVQN
jgi:hypothetical protein